MYYKLLFDDTYTYTMTAIMTPSFLPLGATAQGELWPPE
jgi:hypothetical protein